MTKPRDEDDLLQAITQARYDFGAIQDRLGYIEFMLERIKEQGTTGDLKASCRQAFSAQFDRERLNKELEIFTGSLNNLKSILDELTKDE